MTWTKTIGFVLMPHDSTEQHTDFDFAIDFLSVLDTVDRLAEERKQKNGASRLAKARSSDAEWNIGLIEASEVEEDWTLV